MSDEVNWQQLAEGFRLERNIMQEVAMKAHEAGRREGLEEAHEACIGAGSHLAAYRIRALIDSPEVE